MKTLSAPRRQFLAGTALAALSIAAVAAPAHATAPNETATPGRLIAVEPEPHTSEEDQTTRLLAEAAELAAQRQDVFTYHQQAFVRPDAVELDPSILIAVPGTSTTARDPVNITGVAQMIVDNGGGGVGLCTGSLINPRTVLFAAHCVNTRAATAYGANSGGTAIGFGFETNLRANAPGQTDELVRWLFGTGPNATGRYQTNTAQAFFNVDAVAYNPLSLEPASRGFLYGDVAIAALDTPAAGIPTWSILLSPLPAPGQITAANGTGYRVALAGYGGNGTGTSGTQPIDFRRRVAENWLGALASLADFEGFLFGPGASANLIQNLYFIDFDDPARGTAGASRFDFNAFRDNGLPNEGTTAGGDSGGPLILSQAFTRQLVIGVLSGGYTRFFNGQPANGYGTVSFYQPLYLYWDWIAANNPYRYVGANAGNGNWEDPTRWVSLQDPAYFILGPNGQPINGVPTQTGEQNTGTSGKFGQACFQLSPFNECLDLATGTVTAGTGPIGTTDNNLGTATISPDGTATNQPATAQIDPALAQPEAQAAAQPLPAPTIANGLPGATNFVPNNTAGNRLQGVLPRYFDVTLSNAGTTSLSSTVTIDRLTVRNTAGLTINTGARLNSLIDVTQAGGTITLNGTLSSAGDFALLAGMLQGTGTVIAPFTTSVAGTISPGTMGTIGTLNFTGNLVLASGTVTMIDIAGTNADRIAVTGSANVGGTVALGGITGQVNGLGRQFSIVTATNGVTGTFAPLTISPILRQSFTYQPNAVLLQITAASYSTVIDRNNPVQSAYAQLFDQNRSNAALSGLYALDFASTDTIRSTFVGLAPVNEQAVRTLSGQTINTIQNINDIRLRTADKSNSGGKIAVTGRPLELAQLSFSPASQPIGAEVMALQDGAEDTVTTEGNLPENLGIFLTGGYITGDAGSLPSFTAQTDFDGYYIAGGIEFYPGDSTLVGLSGFYSSLEADVPLGQLVENDTYAASLYLRHALSGGLVIDGQLSLGSMGFDTQRTVGFLGTTQTLASKSDDLLVSGALGISYDLATSFGTISPGLEARYASVDLTTVRETGGTLALGIARENYTSSQARFGVDYEKAGKTVTINANAQLVWEFEDGPSLLGANFATGIGPNAGFALETADQTWVELGLAATFGNGPFTISVGGDTTIGRDTAEAQVVRGTATYRF
ncbi:MAG: autotransporter domain-containing protein [Erythrobacter sp.]|uniref:autotransporter domain-containing protein n=1 Tax=Erythrobacter sp. TaxID=1042 RepID=UPI0025E4A94E|nr:autotransporter domain-containing protein [Erythrobacter sp.]MCM0000797.1 autotransporter domain-containing protein [Erythrobacter sp.]